MSVTLTVSDRTFQRLKAAAKSKGKENVEQLLDEWSNSSDSGPEKALTDPRLAVERIKAFRRKMSEKYGTMTDSTDYIREDRNR